MIQENVLQCGDRKGWHEQDPEFREEFILCSLCRLSDLDWHRIQKSPKMSWTKNTLQVGKSMSAFPAVVEYYPFQCCQLWQILAIYKNTVSKSSCSPGGVDKAIDMEGSLVSRLFYLVFLPQIFPEFHHIIQENGWDTWLNPGTFWLAEQRGWDAGIDLPGVCPDILQRFFVNGFCMWRMI